VARQRFYVPTIRKKPRMGTGSEITKGETTELKQGTSLTRSRLQVANDGSMSDSAISRQLKVVADDKSVYEENRQRRLQ